MSNQQFKKGCFLKKVIFRTFIESLITHKRFIFKESYISYGSSTLQVKCLYLTSPIFNSFSAGEEVKSSVTVKDCKNRIFLFLVVVLISFFPKNRMFSAAQKPLNYKQQYYFSIN